MKRGLTGRYVTVSNCGGEACQAFVPDPLPKLQTIVINNKIQSVYDQALLALGQLNALSTLLPDVAPFTYTFVRQEALLSSQIEGTQSTIDELLIYESGRSGVPNDDVTEVLNYYKAMQHGLNRLEEGFPFCARLIKEIHGELLKTGRGSDKSPGEFRTSQNWLGGSRPGNAVFVPPPHEEIPRLMGDLENFINNKPEQVPTLIKAAWSHVQFETIHPFLDGNGRVGRMLVPMLLCWEKVLDKPYLYLSLYLKLNRQTYYDLLQSIRQTGDWEAWLVFFCEGTKEVASLAIDTAKRLTALFAKDREQIKRLGRVSSSCLRIHQYMEKKPVVTIGDVVNWSGLSHPTVSRALDRMVQANILIEVQGHPKLFVYEAYRKILREGTEPLP